MIFWGNKNREPLSTDEPVEIPITEELAEPVEIPITEESAEPVEIPITEESAETVEEAIEPVEIPITEESAETVEEVIEPAEVQVMEEPIEPVEIVTTEEQNKPAEEPVEQEDDIVRSDTLDELDKYIEVVDDRFIVKRDNGKYPGTYLRRMALAEQVKEDPRYREDIAADIADMGSYRIFAASLRGSSKRTKLVPGVRQDSYSIATVKDKWAIGVVADGVSGAIKSHLIADYMARYAADLLSSELSDIDDLTSVEWKKISAYMVRASREYCNNMWKEHSLEGPVTKYFATTLEFIVLGIGENNKGNFAYVSVSGDGNAFVFDEDHNIRLLRKAETSDGVMSEAVASLPLDPGEPFVRFGNLENGWSLMITTDGYSKSIYNGKTRLADFLFEKLPKVNSIISFLQIMDVSYFQNDDDRTAIMIREHRDGNRSEL